MKALFTKRICSYFIDMLITILIASLITSFIPTNEKTEKITKEINEIAQTSTNENIEISDYIEKINGLNYELTRSTVITSLVTIIINILYFVVLPVYNNGQTVGKKVMHIKIKNNSNEELTMNNLLFRELILHNILLNILTILLVIFMKKKLFINVSVILSLIQVTLFIINLIMIMFKKDGRGIHDIIGNTMVINEEEKI